MAVALRADIVAHPRRTTYSTHRRAITLLIALITAAVVVLRTHKLDPAAASPNIIRSYPGLHQLHPARLLLARQTENGVASSP